jgi:hypothetical protein
MHARTGGIYIASKTKHAKVWKAYRDAGFPLASTWIDEAGKGETENFADLWMRCVWEATNCAVLIAYREKDEVLKGAMIEIGCAIASGRLVLLCGDWEGFSFTAHPLVKIVENINNAFAIGTRATMKFAQNAARDHNTLILGNDTQQ